MKFDLNMKLTALFRLSGIFWSPVLVFFLSLFSFQIFITHPPLPLGTFDMSFIKCFETIINVAHYTATYKYVFPGTLGALGFGPGYSCQCTTGEISWYSARANHAMHFS